MEPEIGSRAWAEQVENEHQKALDKLAESERRLAETQERRKALADTLRENRDTASVETQGRMRTASSSWETSSTRWERSRRLPSWKREGPDSDRERENVGTPTGRKNIMTEVMPITCYIEDSQSDDNRMSLTIEVSSPYPHTARVHVMREANVTPQEFEQRTAEITGFVTMHVIVEDREIYTIPDYVSPNGGGITAEAAADLYSRLSALL